MGGWRGNFFKKKSKKALDKQDLLWYTFLVNEISGCGSAWGRLRAPPVADAASNKEWQQLRLWQASCASDDRALVATGDVCERRLWRMQRAIRSGSGQNLASLKTSNKFWAPQQAFNLRHGYRLLKKPNIGVWLSLVERLVRDQEAGSSNLLTPTK